MHKVILYCTIFVLLFTNIYLLSHPLNRMLVYCKEGEGIEVTVKPNIYGFLITAIRVEEPKGGTYAKFRDLRSVSEMWEMSRSHKTSHSAKTFFQGWRTNPLLM